MYSCDASKEFCRKVGIDINSLDAENVEKMVSAEAEYEKGQHPRLSYSKCVDIALARMLQWHLSADEYKVTPLTNFIVSHRQACVWTVLFTLTLKGVGVKI